jgi:hypothetical protein
MADVPRPLDGDSPAARAVEQPGTGNVIALSRVAGLHHRYVRKRRDRRNVFLATTGNPRLDGHSTAFQAHTRCNIIARVKVGQYAKVPTIAQTTSDIVTSTIRSRRIWNYSTAGNGWAYQLAARVESGATRNNGPAGHADAGALIRRLVGRSDALSAVHSD